MKLLLSLSTLLALAVQAPAPATTTQTPLRSAVYTWESLSAAPTRTGERRAVFDAPTGTLDKLHAHVTTLNPEENTGPVHRHPQEEMVIVRQGTLEVNIDGRKSIAGPGSIVYFAVNENENMTNIGTTPAIYVVVQWFTPLTPKS